MRHPHIEEDDLRPKLAHALGYPAGITALANDVEVGSLMQQLPEPPARQLLVVDEEDSVPRSDHTVS
jgi:hypothetical protein